VIPLNKNIFFNPTSSRHNIPFQHVNLESNFSVTMTDITAIVNLTFTSTKTNEGTAVALINRPSKTGVN
jgi:hypothetical protein